MILFTFKIHEQAKYARVFVNGKLLQPSLMFASSSVKSFETMAKGWKERKTKATTFE
jgi:hypothetical protein